MPATWTQENKNYLIDNWGTVSIPRLSINLKKSEHAITIKAQKMELGPFLENGEYITINQFFIAIGRYHGTTFTLDHWIKKGLPMKKKKVKTCSFKVIYLQDFWKWAKEYRMHIDFNKFEENALGIEPSWVKEQRKADQAFAKYKVTPWTKEEDEQLKSLLKLYKYTYKELSLTILRTEGAIKRRMVNLGIKERPLREPPHGIWTPEEINIVKDMYARGYRSEVIKEYINKSGQATGGKIDRLIKEGVLVKHK